MPDKDNENIKLIKAKITANHEIAKSHFEMELESAYLGAVSSPGQFVNVKAMGDVTDPLLRIPLGVHKIRGRGISLLYKAVGLGTKILSGRKQGETLDVLGPLGNGFDAAAVPAEKGARAVLVAGGHGIAPLYALAESLEAKNVKIEFLIGVRSKDHIVCVEDLASMGAEVYIATEDGTCGYKGYVTDILKQRLRQNATGERRTTIYACGPRPMLAAVAEIAKRGRIRAQVSLDAYMACGIGACLGCAVRTIDGYKLACKDGPVFDAAKVVWEAENAAK
ncbi:MAG: dihydroorotate dehydrogenase electron transfer subunit [Candidatus Omnitrophota bacterium]